MLCIRQRTRTVQRNPLPAATQEAAAAVRVVWQDGCLAFVEKPRGLATRAGSGPGPTLAACLPAVLAPGPGADALPDPAPVHRLDGPTGGLVLVAKTRAALRLASTAFAAREVRKRYRAVVWGRLAAGGVVDIPLDGKPASTGYSPLRWHPMEPSGGRDAGVGTGERGAGSLEGNRWTGTRGAAPGSALAVTVLDLAPVTGRTHQLRRHLALMGHPIVGDPKYTSGYAAQRALALGDPAAEEGWRAGGGQTVAPGAIAGATPHLPTGLHLWSVGLGLRHPITSEPLTLQLDEPPEVAALLEALQRMHERWRLLHGI